MDGGKTGVETRKIISYLRTKISQQLMRVCDFDFLADFMPTPETRGDCMLVV